MSQTERYQILDLARLPPTPCPCGTTRRAFLDQGVASLHLLEVREDSAVHHHERTTEMYYVLEGHGHIELDGERHPLRPGVAVMIHPGCRHRAVGELRLLVIPVPSFDPDDEFLEG